MGKVFRHLTKDDRMKIKSMIDKGYSTKTIATSLDVSISTIYREINRGKLNNEYEPNFAQIKYENELKNKGSFQILEKDNELKLIISNLILFDHLSPQKISLKLRKENVNISTNTIYSAIDKGLIANVNRKSLERKTTTVFSDGLIQIPKHIRKELNIKDGDNLEIKVENKDILIKIIK